MIKIANFILDEKFIDDVIINHKLVNFEDIHHDYILCNESTYVFKFIKNTDCIKIISHKYILRYIIEHDYDAVFIHSLYSFPIKLISKIHSTIKVFWFAWGYDIYELPYRKPLIPKELYHNITKGIIKNNNKTKHNIIKSLLDISRDYLSIIHTHKLLKRIDFFSGIIPNEYTLVSFYNQCFKAKQVQYSYVNQNLFSRSNDDNIINKANNILIGNSADPTNNHIDIFELIKNYKLDNRKIIVPLSYSGNKKYINTVVSYGKNLFNDKLIPIETFMQYTDYIKLINSCNVAIFYHERQQALGNIIVSIYNGCKVFLSQNSPLYLFLKSQNLIIFSIQKNLNSKELELELSIQEINHNKSILQKLYGKESYVNNLKNIYSLIKC